MPNATKQVIKTVQEVEQVTDWTKIDTQIEFDGKKIKLPSDPSNMDYDVAIDTIGRIRDQEAQEYDVQEMVAGAPWDTLVAVYRAMQDIYGVVLSQSMQTWFGEVKPDFVTVVTGPNDEDRVQVPMGQMSLPGVKVPIFVQMRPNGTVIAGTVKRADRARLVEIANRARALLTQDSVYKGKAIRLMVDDSGDLQLHTQPEFLQLSGVRESDMIHTRTTEMLIQTNLMAPLKHTAACRANKVPLKRGILLEGKYGTGKSLTARVTAKVATDHGWTFIMLNRSQGLKQAIEFARAYQPCVIFAEDIDRAADRENEDVNDLVNLLDGLITKNMEMMVVLTTNFIDKIDRSLLRPGRFDAVISIDAPDAETSAKIVRAYAGPLLAADADLTEVGETTAGMIPASIREVVERAKLGMLTEGRDNIVPNDLLASALGMQRHMALLNPVVETKSVGQAFADSLMDLLGDTLAEQIEEAAGGGSVRHTETLTRLNKALLMLGKSQEYLGVIHKNAAAGANSSQAANEKADRILQQI